MIGNSSSINIIELLDRTLEVKLYTILGSSVKLHSRYYCAGCMSRTANAVRLLADNLVGKPMKGVTSSDMPRVGA